MLKQTFKPLAMLGHLAVLVLTCAVEACTRIAHATNPPGIQLHLQHCCTCPCTCTKHALATAHAIAQTVAKSEAPDSAI